MPALNVLDKYVPRAQFVQGDVTDFTAIAGVNQPINTNTYFARVDHNFSEDRVFGRLAWDRSGLTRNNINPNIPVFVDSKATNLASQWIHTISPSTINELRFGFNTPTTSPRTRAPTTPPSTWTLSASARYACSATAIASLRRASTAFRNSPACRSRCRS